MKIRTRDLAVRITKLYSAFAKSDRSQSGRKANTAFKGTSFGAHYRESQFAKSDADFTANWLEIIDEMRLFNAEKLAPLRIEASELTAIFVTIVKKVKSKV